VGVRVRMPTAMVALCDGVAVGVFVAAATRTSGSLLSVSADTATYAPRQITTITPRNRNEYARFSIGAIIPPLIALCKAALVLRFASPYKIRDAGQHPVSCIIQLSSR